jgi:hypothetical protein
MEDDTFTIIYYYQVVRVRHLLYTTSAALTIANSQYMHGEYEQ